MKASTSLRRALPFGIFLSLRKCASVHGFSAFQAEKALPAVVGRPRRSFVTKTILYSTTSPNRQVAGKQEVAVDALSKLLERQRADVLETEALLRRLSTKTANITESLEIDEQETGWSRSSAVAASIAAGTDYGFVSRSEGSRSNLLGGSSYAFEGYGPPSNILSLGMQQFKRNLDAIKGEYKDEDNIKLTPKQIDLQKKLRQLTLNSTAIWERETAHGPIDAPWVIKLPYIVLCYLLDVVFEGRYVPSRFFLLETVARMPYFSYITMLHLYETLGFWRRSSDVKRVHFAEEWNEFHHLLIMESLGGDQAWWVRFLAQHSALVYYVVLCALWALSPTLAYKFSELLETHAVNTYGGLLDENEELLKELPPSIAAVEYYSFGASDPFFGEYQTSALATGGEVRQPGENMRSLYDVFSAIRADEGDHVSTMKACLDPNVAVASPSLEKKILTGVALAAAVGYFVSTGDFADPSDVGDMVDGISSATEAGSAVDDIGATLIEGLIGGVAAFSRQFLEDEKEGDLVGIGSDLFEAGTTGAILEQLRKAFIEALEILGRLRL